MKITRNQLANMIKESIRRQLLRESDAYLTYVPCEREILNSEIGETSPELDNILNKEYKVVLSGRSWSEAPSNPYGWGEGHPGGSGVDNIKISDDGGFYEDLQALENVNPELADELRSDFEDWCMDHDETNTEFS